MKAAAGGHLDVVTRLAELGANLATVDNVGTQSKTKNKIAIFLILFWLCSVCHQDGDTALMLAAAKGHVEVIDNLVQLGLDLAAANKVRTGICISNKEHGSNSGCAVLCSNSHQDGMNALMWAVHYGHFEV